MRLLFELDKKDFDPNGSRFVRPSARGICIRSGRIAMVHSLKYDYYKFPGGGIEPGEDPVGALLREFQEETGLAVLPASVREYGLFRRVEASDHPDADIFVQDNYYYFCDAGSSPQAQQLDDYEAEEGFTLEYITAAHGARANRSSPYYAKQSGMLEREALVLELLVREGLLPE